MAAWWPTRSQGRPCVFLAGLYRAEQGIAERLLRLAAGTPPWPAIDPATGPSPGSSSETGLILAASQREAVRLALRSKLLVITGGPGVGKTTLVNAILDDPARQDARTSPWRHPPAGRPSGCARPPGSRPRPCIVCSRPIPVRGGFKRDEEHQLDCELLVVDEVSMVDVPLLHSLLKAVPPRAALILVGDVDQLPSVGPGQVLADIIASAAVPVVRLTEVFRQAAQSRIITNAHRINQGLMPEPGHGARQRLPPRRAARTPRTASPSCWRSWPGASRPGSGSIPIRDVQVLCPMNRGGLGARSLNLELQQLLNPPGEARVERFGWTFGPGDKVMQVVNDYEKEVFNGDLGLVKAIDSEAGELLVDFDGREVAYDFGELDELVLAYATTVHKAQGSEYPAVVIPVTTQHYPMLQRNLLYTAVTRGRQLVVLVAQPKAVAIAVKGGLERRRWSKLGEWLTLARGKPERNNEADASQRLRART